MKPLYLKNVAPSNAKHAARDGVSIQTTLGLTGIALILSACTHDPEAISPHSLPHIGIVNPASAFCIEQGGQLRMLTTAQGVHGICVLPDGQAIDEWVFFRQHPVNHP